MLNSKYITVVDASAYFATRLRSEYWEEATPSDKDKALITATRMIDKLAFRGDKTSTTQELEFPRDGDTTVPEKIQWACAELAIILLQGIDPERDARDLTRTGEGFLGVRTTYDRTATPEHITAGVPSRLAWDFLKPYLKAQDGVTISRVS